MKLFIKLYSAFFIVSSSFINLNLSHSKNKDLVTDDPKIVIINSEDENSKRKIILKKPCKKIKFILKNGKKSLRKEDKDDIYILLNKYNKLKNCAGLAAPQIGISKSIIVFGCTGDEETKKHRPDLIQEFPRGTIWINPVYRPRNINRKKDYEACFSIKDTVFLVERYKEIYYEAYLPNGDKIAGVATGFAARIIQHEIDHINGVLCQDRANKNEQWNSEEFKKNYSKIKQKCH